MLTIENKINDIEISPHGERLTYLEVLNDLNKLCLLNINTNEVTECTDYLFEKLNISWAPVGNTIAVNYNYYGFAVSYVYDYETKIDTNLTADNYVVEGIS